MRVAGFLFKGVTLGVKYFENFVQERSQIFKGGLKIMMEELSTTATGFQVDGGLLRGHSTTS